MKKKPNRTRNNLIQFYLDDNELFILDEKVKAARVRSRSAYMRRLLIDSLIYEIDYSELHRNNELLGHISGNINQIAKRANATGQVFGDDILEIKEMMKTIWLIQESMLSGQP